MNSAADELNKMIDELDAIYGALEAKGATMPESKNYKNIAITIESIGPNPYANAYAILYTPGSDLEWDTVDDADSVRAVMNGSSYWPNPNGHTNLKFTEKCRELTDITIIGQSSSGSFAPSENIKVLEGLNNFLGVTEIGRRFLYNTRTQNTIEAVTSYPPNLTRINTGFLFGCSKFNYPVILPESVTYIRGFLEQCSSFNSEVKLPSGLTDMDQGFLSNCTAFNQPLSIPDGITVIPSNFLDYCSSFNQPIVLPNVTAIGNSFLANCRNFTQPITIPDTVTSIGTEFLYSCTSFNHPVTIPNGVTTLLGRFLASATEFDSVLTLPDTITSIGDNFMRGCGKFNQELHLPSRLEIIGGSFLENCYQYSQPITIHDTVKSIGTNFLYGCSAFVGPLTVGTANCPTDTNSLSQGTASAPAYQTGITLAGPYAQVWKDALPDRTTSPYRKLIVDDGAKDAYIITYTPNSDIAPTYYGLNEANNLLLYGTVTELPNPNRQYTNVKFTENCQNLKISRIRGSSSFMPFVQVVEGLENLTSVTEIGANFMIQNNSDPNKDAPVLTTITALPPNVTTIEFGFLSGCYSFTSPITISSKVTSIGSSFMFNCRNFTGPLTVNTSAIPERGETQQEQRLSLNTDYYTYPAFAQGIKVDGTYASAWKAALPNRLDYNSDVWIRKLV